MDEFTVEQSKNSQENVKKRVRETTHLTPWQFKKGQSGNPLGRTPGKSLKEYAKEYLRSLSDEERLDYFEGMNKKDIWLMAEGNPETKTENKISGNLTFTEVNYANTTSPQVPAEELPTSIPPSA